jgi:hypothetical protein
MERFLMTTYGQLLTHETYICLKKNWVAMEREKPVATNYIRNCHKKLWTRSQFSTRSKVDCVTNNLAECFNNWIKQHKSVIVSC